MAASVANPVENSAFLFMESAKHPKTREIMELYIKAKCNKDLTVCNPYGAYWCVPVGSEKPVFPPEIPKEEEEKALMGLEEMVGLRFIFSPEEGISTVRYAALLLGTKEPVVVYEMEEKKGGLRYRIWDNELISQIQETASDRAYFENVTKAPKIHTTRKNPNLSHEGAIGNERTMVVFGCAIHVSTNEFFVLCVNTERTRERGLPCWKGFGAVWCIPIQHWGVVFPPEEYELDNTNSPKIGSERLTQEGKTCRVEYVGLHVETEEPLVIYQTDFAKKPYYWCNAAKKW